MGTQLKQRPIAMQDPISKELGRQASQSTPVPKGSIAKIAQKYDPRNSTRLLGMLLKFDFDASHIITCDPWKRNCGGIPRGAFIILRLDPEGVEPEDAGYSQRLTLARVLEEAPTPIDAQTQQTLFQIHKMQAQMDPLTHKDLQWSGLKASVLGTFYDYEGEIAFGNDVDTFFAPLSYVAFMPSAEDLDQLINAFVDPAKAVEIGNLRYTETLPLKRVDVVPIKINPEDLVGSLNSAQRTANFGKTRFGKSNTTKIFAQALFHTKPDVGQLFIDTSGEYTYINSQDGTSLFYLNKKHAVRYALAGQQLPKEQTDLGLDPPFPLAINFYSQPDVGHSLIITLWDSYNTNTPGYMRPILDWSPEPPRLYPKPSQQDGEAISRYKHYWRTMGMYYTLLKKQASIFRIKLVSRSTFQKK